MAKFSYKKLISLKNILIFLNNVRILTFKYQIFNQTTYFRLPIKGQDIN